MIVRSIGGLALAAALVIGAAIHAHADVEIEGDPKIAFIYFNVKDDGGWVQAQEEARVAVENETGYDTAYTEKVEEVASKVRPVVERYISRGYNIIAGSAYGYGEVFEQLAKENPNIAFVNAPGTTMADNLEGYYARTYETQFLCGMIAGALSKTNKLGFVAAIPLSLTNWNANAWHLGAQLMNPNVETHVIFTNAWYDPVKERATAQALIEQGADVLGQHQDTPSTQIAAQEAGLHSTGYHRDMSEYAPNSNVCSSIWTWDRYLIPTFKEIAGGPWKSKGILFLGIKDGGTDIACCGDAVPQEIVDNVMAMREKILSGERHVFEGPLYKQDGTLVVDKGEQLDDGQIWGMNYLVKGIVGTLPGS
jgi:basic membrane lipoprotein Med (substrate-binding protein (PBP1-ABC) superfamily)